MALGCDFGVMETFWNLIEVVVAPHGECTNATGSHTLQRLIRYDVNFTCAWTERMVSGGAAGEGGGPWGWRCDTWGTHYGPSRGRAEPPHSKTPWREPQITAALILWLPQGPALPT